MFIYRHYVQDKGVFPPEMAADLEMVGERAHGQSRRHLALRGPRAGIAVVAITHHLAVY